MYVSVGNHLFHFAHFILAFNLLFILYPKLIFKREQETLFENIVSNFIRMVFIVIIIGYTLVILKLFEFIGIFIILLLLYLYVTYSRMDPDVFVKRTMQWKALFFDYLDAVKSPKEDLKLFMKERYEKIKEKIRVNSNNKAGFWSSMTLIIVVIYSAYLRLYDAYIHAAPPMSDAYVTLEWMKFIIRRQLFNGGIYPQGSHIYLATIQKFSFIDPIYILKYAGPFNGVFTAIGIYFVVSRLTSRAVPGIIATLLYGVLGKYFIGAVDWERQAAANSQEFSFIFVLPTLYFFYRYIEKNENKDRLTALSGLAVTGLVHTVAFAFIAIGVAILALSAFIIEPIKSWKKIIDLIFMGILSALISVTPIGIGLLLGKSFHNSSVDFLVAREQQVVLPTLRIVDYVGLLGIFIMALLLLVNVKSIRKRLTDIFIILLGSFSFLIYYYGGYVTQSVLVETRFSAMWNLTLLLIIGISFSVLFKPIKESLIRIVLELSLCVVLIASCIFYFKPQPIIPYKMEYNSNIEQYLRISRMLNPTEWLIASQNEAYSLVLGKGYHLLIRDFVDLFDPEKEFLINKNTQTVYKIPDIFIFQEKKLFTTPFENLKQEYERRRADNIQIEEWVGKYKKTHSNLTLFYEDNNIRIYRIHQVFTKDENVKKIWGSQ